MLRVALACLAFSLSCAIPAYASAACDCQDTNGDGRPDVGGVCTQSTPAVVTNTAGPEGSLSSESQSITVDDVDGDGQVSCFMFANGDFGIVGEGSPKRVRVIATSPASNGGGTSDGWMVNPMQNDNGFGFELGSYSAPPALPQEFDTGSGPVSFMVGTNADLRETSSTGGKLCQSNSENSRSCLQFVSVFTFVDTAPTDGHDLLRPQFAGPGGAKWDAIRVSDMLSLVSAIPMYPIPSGAPSMAAVARRVRWPGVGAHINSNTSHTQFWRPRHNYAPGFAGQKTSYGGNLAASDNTVVMRFMHNDFDRTLPPGSDSRAAFVGAVQKGMDYIGGLMVGGCFGPACNESGLGAIPIGYETLAYFAAYATQDPEILAAYAQVNDEGRLYASDMYRNPAKELFGYPTPSPKCPSGLTAQNQCNQAEVIKQHCIADDMVRDPLCCSAKSYNVHNANTHTSIGLIVKALGDASPQVANVPRAVIWGPAIEGFAVRYSTQGALCDGTGDRPNGYNDSGPGSNQMNPYLHAMWPMITGSMVVDPVDPEPPGDEEDDGDPPPPPVLNLAVDTSGFPVLTFVQPAGTDRCDLNVRRFGTEVDRSPDSPWTGLVTEDTPRQWDLADSEAQIVAGEANNYFLKCRPEGGAFEGVPMDFDFTAAFAALEPEPDPDPEPDPCPECEVCEVCPEPVQCLTADDLAALPAPQVSCPETVVNVEAPIVNPTPVSCPELPAPVCEAPVVDLQPVVDAIQMLSPGLTTDQVKEAVRDAFREAFPPQP